MFGKWSEMTLEQRIQLLEWVKMTCILGGSTLYTAYAVAAEFAKGLDRAPGQVGP